MESDTQQWDYSIFWKEALNQIRQYISEQEYVMWFRNLQYYASRENEIILAVPSSFYRDQVKQRYLKLIQDTLFDLSGMSIQVNFEIVKLQPPADHTTADQDPRAGGVPAQQPVDNSVQADSSKSAEQHRTANTEIGTSTSKAESSYSSDYSEKKASEERAKKSTSKSSIIVDPNADRSGSGIPAHSSPSAPFEKAPRQDQQAAAAYPHTQQNSPSRAAGTSSPQQNLRKHNELRIDYTFENFVVGDNNSFAANACIAISKNPGTAYNPCLIYGGVGLGKTHLIQSIGNFVHNNYEKTRVVYVTAETFTNEFIQSIRDGKNHQFKNRYRNVDVLLIDDIHFLQSKDQTQEELFHTFNALYDSNKQMVFTCDRPVSELKHLTDRLRSRFERGLNVDLQPPNYETRYAILKRKTEEKRAAIDEQVIELISKNITTNVRDLEAALTKLIAYSDILNKKITVDIAQEQLKDVFSSPKQSNITIEIIQRAVADYFNLSPYDLRGKKRTKAIAFPRQIAMYITREITEFSTTEVGLEFGGRDHTTVMHACQRIESRMQTDPYLEPTIQRLIRQIKEYGTK
ncbi:MAG: chromosomal replication initiator protein DnaA [Spirochaetia bacterium]